MLDRLKGDDQTLRNALDVRDGLHTPQEHCHRNWQIRSPAAFAARRNICIAVIMQPFLWVIVEWTGERYFIEAASICLRKVKQDMSCSLDSLIV